MFVSPNLRALETCERVFSKTPKQKLERIKVYVHPGVQSRVNHITDLALRWKDKTAMCPLFDTKYMSTFSNDLSWQCAYYLDILSEAYPVDSKDYQVRASRIKGLEQLLKSASPQNLQSAFEQIATGFQEIEDKQMMSIRLKRFSKDLLEESVRSGVPGSQILIISHNGVLKALFGSKVENSYLSTGNLSCV